MKEILLTTLFLLLCATVTLAEKVTVAWDPNSEGDLAGYNVYYGNSSGIYDNSVNVGNQTSYTILGLVSGQDYFIAVTAYDTSGNESGYSDELSYTVPITDTTPPAIPKNLKKVIVEVTIKENGVRVVVKAE